MSNVTLAGTVATEPTKDGRRFGAPTTFDLSVTEHRTQSVITVVCDEALADAVGTLAVGARVVVVGTSTSGGVIGAHTVSVVLDRIG